MKIHVPCPINKLMIFFYLFAETRARLIETTGGDNEQWKTCFEK
jgi:hypothetical protein